MLLPSYEIPAADLQRQESIKSSRFITRVFVVASQQAAKGQIKTIKEQYPDASHHCWAYIVGDPRATTLVGSSDDGEPSGTAGKPMLQVLQHSNIGDILVICIRYFGGTKLGTGGLARAYGGGVKRALEALSLVTKIFYSTLRFSIEYAVLKDCEYLLKNYQIKNLEIDFQTSIHMILNVASDQKDDLKKALINLTKDHIEWHNSQDH